ncbi:MAG: LysM peptidoglycan-binding domain-containing protein [Chlamydiota bacterium]|nr:LysM peptidoglycan-binding domain-containing protein [Chlamydiota bacterium]
MKNLYYIFVLLWIGIVCSSCISTSIATKDDVDHVNVRQSNLGAELAQQNQKINALELSNERDRKEYDKAFRHLNRQFKVMEENVVQLQDTIRRLHDNVSALQSENHAAKSQMQSFAKKFDMILDEVSKENERILQQLKKSYPSGPDVHIVQKGETLSKIANSYGITLDALISANNLKDADQIYVGQKLRIPDR